jgi:hypothetical protein
LHVVARTVELCRSNHINTATHRTFDRFALIDRGLPTHPHHHEGSWPVGRYLNIPGARALSLADAVVLVERVRASASRGARECFEALAAAVPVPIASISIRACPKLPPATEERIADNRAQTLADSVKYREALATAAEARGWSVHWYDRERVFATRRRHSAAGTSTLSCTRWADRSGRLGRLNTSLRQMRRLLPQGTPRRGRPPDNMQLQRTVIRHRVRLRADGHVHAAACIRRGRNIR